MKIDSLKDLDKLILLCRKRGIETVKIDNIEFRLSDSLPQPKTQPKRSSFVTEASGSSVDKILSPDALTEDQLLFYSAEGRSEQ